MSEESVRPVSPPTPEHEPAQTPKKTTNRRTAIKLGAALAPVILTFHAKPALAQSGGSGYKSP